MARVNGSWTVSQGKAADRRRPPGRRRLRRLVFTRLRVDPRTQAYYERRTQEGKIRREIVRCLKRYADREVCDLVDRIPAERTVGFGPEATGPVRAAVPVRLSYR